MQADIRKTISKLKAMLAKKQEPKVDIGPHCTDPYECDFMDYCWSHIPEVSVFSIARLRSEKKFALYNKGIIHYKEVRKEIELTTYQQLQVDGHLNKKKHIDIETYPCIPVNTTLPIILPRFRNFPVSNTIIRPVKILPADPFPILPSLSEIPKLHTTTLRISGRCQRR